MRSCSDRPSCSSGASKRSWSRSTRASCDWRGSPRSKDPNEQSVQLEYTGELDRRNELERSRLSIVQAQPTPPSIVDRARQPQDPLPTGVPAWLCSVVCWARPRIGDRLSHGGATADDRRRRCAGQGSRDTPRRSAPDSPPEQSRSLSDPSAPVYVQLAAVGAGIELVQLVAVGPRVDVQRLVGWLRDAMDRALDIDALTPAAVAVRWLDGEGPAASDDAAVGLVVVAPTVIRRSDLSGIEHLLAMNAVVAHRCDCCIAGLRSSSSRPTRSRGDEPPLPLIEVRPQQRTASAS